MVSTSAVGNQGGVNDRAPAGSVIRLLIADDHAVVRAGIRQFVAAHSDLSVVGEAGTGAEVLDCVQREEFDVLILDISMP